MTRYHLTLGNAREQVNPDTRDFTDTTHKLRRSNIRGGQRGRRPARITAAQVDHVVNAMQPTKEAYSFKARMEKYAADAAEDAKLYAWLEARGQLPPPGELPAANQMTLYRRWKREQAAQAEARS